MTVITMSRKELAKLQVMIDLSASSQSRRGWTRICIGRWRRWITWILRGASSVLSPINLTVQYDRVMFLLEQNDYTLHLARKKVEIHDFSDGRIEIRHNGRTLPYRTFDRIRRVDQGAVVENKRLTEALEYCKHLQERLPPIKRSRKAPKRSAQNRHVLGAVTYKGQLTPRLFCGY